MTFGTNRSKNKKRLLLGLLVLCFFVTRDADAAKFNRSQNAKLNSGLIGLWSFDGKDISNGVALDRSVSGNNGNLVNIATSTFYTNGKIGQAFKFSKTIGQGVKLGTTVNAGTNFSYGSWFYSTHNGFTTGAALMGKYTSGTSFWTIQSRTAVDGDFGCTMRAGVSVSAIVSGVSGYMDGSWHHVMCVKSGTTLSLYIDGAFVTSTTNASMTSTTGTTESTYIGDYGAGNEPWSGKIDDVRLYDRALSAAEVKALYLAGGGKANASQNTKKNSGLVGLWSFDGKDISNGVALDRSGSSKNGGLKNIATSTFYTNGKIGQAFNLDGGNDYILFSSSILNPQTSSATLSGWVNFDAFDASAPILSTDEGNPTLRLAVNPSGQNGLIHMLARDQASVTASVTGTTPLSVGTWYHLTYVWNQSAESVTVYLNGVLEGTAANTSLNLSGVNFPAGLYGLGVAIRSTVTPVDNYLNGKMDDVRIYNRALSAAEVKALYLAGGGTQNASQNLKQTSGLVGLWSFDGKDISNGVVLDRSGNGYNGNLINIATSTFYTNGKIGQAFNFDGVTATPDAMNVGASADFNLSTYTVAGWIKISSSGETANIDKIFYKGNSSTKEVMSVYLTTGKLAVEYYNAPTNYYKVGTTDLRDGQWHHIAGIRSAGVGMYVYVDGIEQTGGVSAADGGLTTTDTNIARFGRRAADSGFNGKMDEMRIYNRALSAAEVYQLYNAGR